MEAKLNAELQILDSPTNYLPLHHDPKMLPFIIIVIFMMLGVKGDPYFYTMGYVKFGSRMGP